MGPRLDRNGIPILDPPHEANKLPKLCQNDNHFWVTVKTEYTGYDYMHDMAETKTTSICRDCKQTRTGYDLED